jgi:hypothetical protein
MTQATTTTITVEKKNRLSLDTWAVIVALLAAILIRAGIITRVPW